MDIEFATFQSMINSKKTEEGVFARFYNRAVRTGGMTKDGFPEFKDQTFIEIRLKDNADIYDQPAKDADYKRFPVEFARFQLEKKQVESGTPLEQFAFLTAAQVETCKHRGIFTVETLSNLDDEKAKSINLVNEKQLAKKFTDVSKNNAAIADFAKKEKKYQEEIKKLKAEIAELKAKKND